jgi:hypothetical protein
MAAVGVKLDSNIGTLWTSACRQAVHDLNTLFRHKGVAVTLALNGAGPRISVRTDPGIAGTAVHGRTSAETDGAGKLIRADVRLPVKLTINSPRGIRDAGAGMAEVIAAHELVHALGHEPHNTHLMAQTLQKVLGDRAAGDKLQAGSVAMPPLQLSDESIEMLKGIWS